MKRKDPARDRLRGTGPIDGKAGVVEEISDLSGYRQVADTAKLFADPVRLWIIESLAQGPRTIELLARACGQPLKNVSHHLQKLLAAGMA